MSDRIESDRTIEVLPGQLGGSPIPTHADPMPGRSTSRLVRVPSAGGGETGKPLEALHRPHCVLRLVVCTCSARGRLHRPRGGVMARVAIAQEVWIKRAARIGGNTFADQAIVGPSKGSGSRARTAGNKKPRLEAGLEDWLRG